MEKETKKPAKKNDVEQLPCKLIIEKEQTVQYKICPLCGHSNKSTEGFCKMCSNYLY